VADTESREQLHEYAGGWMKERKGTDAPPFLKATYVVIACGCLGYALLYMNGEVNNASRGALVRQLNASTGDANRFMYFVAALAAVFVVVLWRFAFSKPHE
jgi:hypothetical protein